MIYFFSEHRTPPPQIIYLIIGWQFVSRRRFRQELQHGGVRRSPDLPRLGRRLPPAQVLRGGPSLQLERRVRGIATFTLKIIANICYFILFLIHKYLYISD